VRRVAGGVAVVVIAAALTACGGSQDTTRRQIATYLAAVNQIERQLATPLDTVDAVDRQLTAGSGASRTAATTTTTTSGARLTAAAQERRLRQAARQIAVVTARLHALAAPVPAAHLKSLLVALAGRQADLAVQTERLIAFIPGFSASLRPLGPAVSALERVLSISQASSAAGVQRVYGQKATALRSFARTLDGILASLRSLHPPSSSQPTYVAERRSLNRMKAAATTLAGDLAGGHTVGITGVLRSFDSGAALPGSRSTQEAERAAVRAYDRQVSELTSLATAVDHERLQLAQRFP
jgi:hypothetical protein